MQPSAKTFSESWHRVVGLRVGLRPTVRVKRQFFRGEKWYVLHNPFNNQYFRLRPEAHEFVIRLRSERTVEEVWEECLDRQPDGAPGQEDVIQLLTQLHFANFLYSDMPADSAKKPWPCSFAPCVLRRPTLNRSANASRPSRPSSKT